MATNAGDSEFMIRQSDDEYEGESEAEEELEGQDRTSSSASGGLGVAGLMPEPPREQEYKRLTAKEWRAIRLAHKSKAEDLRHSADAVEANAVVEFGGLEDDDVAGEGETSRYWEEESWEEERRRREST